MRKLGINDSSSLALHISHFDSDANYANNLSFEEFAADPSQNPGLDQPLQDNYKLYALVYDTSFGDHDLTIKNDFKDENTKMFWSGLYFEFDEWEHRSALEQFFKRKGLYAEDGTAIKVPRRFRTYLMEVVISKEEGEQKNMKNNPIPLAALAVLLATPSFAQEQSEAKDKIHALDEVVVTAGKMETEVEKIPSNIEVITREDIEKVPGVVYINDLLQKVPGLWAPRFQSGVANDGSFSARGSEVNSQGLRVMVNGIELNKGNGYVVLPRIPLHDVERIEVIKTASAEYGDQAVGGIINVVTATSSKEIEAKIGTAFGDFDYGTAYTVVKGGIDNFEYFFDLGFSRSGGYQDDTEYDPINAYTRLAYAINDSTELEFHGSHMESEGVWPTKLTQAQFDADPQQSPGKSTAFENDYDLGALVLSKYFGNDVLKAKLIGKDEYVSMNFAFPFGDREFEFTEWEIYPSITYQWQRPIGNMSNQLLVGVEYRNHELTSRQYSLTNGTREDTLRDTLREDTSYAAYAVDELSVTEDVTVTAGVRFDAYEQDQTGRVDPANTVSQSDQAVSPKIGATYSINEMMTLFGGFNSGYKSPARTPGMAYSADLDPEKVYSYEAGLRGMALPWLSYNVTGFVNQYQDKWVKSGPEATDPYVNAGETEAIGLELALGADFGNGFFADVNCTLQESEYTKYANAGVSYDGNKIPNVPEQMLGGTIGYRDPVWGQFTFNADYVGGRYFNEQNTLKGDDYWIFGAGYKKTIEQWDPQVSFFVDLKNLTDEDAVVYGGGAPGSEQLVPVYGQQFLVGLEMMF
jgi:iron complex outermembrane receptor protein